MNIENDTMTDDQIIESEIIPMSDEDFTSLMTGKAPVTKATPKADPAPKPDPKPAGKPAPAGKAATMPTAEEVLKDEDPGDTDIEEVSDIKDLFAGPDQKPGKQAASEKSQPAGDGNIDLAALRATADYLMEKGYWKEIENWENVDLTTEVYAQIAEQQAIEQAEDILSELMDRTGKYRKILEHAMSGHGSPDAILDLFQQERRLNATDPKNITDSETLIRNYYSTVVGWEDNDVESFIDKARTEKTLEKHSEFAKKKYQEFIDKQIQQQDSTRLKAEKQAKAQREQYEVGVKNAIAKFKFPAEFSSVMEQFAFKPAIKVPDTNKVLTGYQARMLQIQSNPEEYVDLLHYLLDKEGYIKSRSTVKQNKQNEKTFESILAGGRTGQPKTGSGIIQRSTNSEEYSEKLPAWSNFFKTSTTKK